MKALIFDIEGTTTDIHFVHNILFPYAKDKISDFVKEHAPKIEHLLSSIKTNYNVSSENEVIELLKTWINEDKKIKELKEIQGFIWENGYQKGEYKAHLYQDVLPSLEKWKEKGLKLYIYSSGSVHAQKLLFAHTEFGDITSLFSGHFDTTVGGKKQSTSYSNILNKIGYKAQDVAFFTDSPDEVLAAKDAGMRVFHVNRDGLYDESTDNMITSFLEAKVLDE